MKIRVRRDVLETYLKAIKALTNEAFIRIYEDKIETIVVDTANVAMVNTTIDQMGFDAFPEEGDIPLSSVPVKLGVDIAKMFGYVTNLGADIELKFYYDEELNGKGKISMATGKEAFSMGLLDGRTMKKEPNVPGLALDTVGKVKGTDLSSAIKKAEMVSDKVFFRMYPDKKLIELFAHGDDDYLKPIDEVVSLEGDVQAIALFSMDYLKDMMKVVGKSDEVTIRLKDDHPIKMLGSFPDVNVEVMYFLAPRIEHDDD